MLSSNPVSDVRVFPRIDCCLDLEIGAFGISRCDLEAVDLSLTGVGLEFATALNPFVFVPGTSVEISIPSFEPLEARICWVGGRRMGLQFLATLPEIFESWVGEVMAAQGVMFKDVTRVTS